jgi:hypothetical protein
VISTFVAEAIHFRPTWADESFVILASQNPHPRRAKWVPTDCQVTASAGNVGPWILVTELKSRGTNEVYSQCQ